MIGADPWDRLGETLVGSCETIGGMALRIYLTGRVTLEGDGVIDQDAFPGKQGLLVFARLAIDRTHALSREELAGLLWPESPPRAWDAALHSIVSKLRALLAKSGLGKTESISSALGCYQLCLPDNAWIDIEAGLDAIHEAEGFVQARKWREAWAAAQVAYHVSRRPFLTGEGGPWVDEQREGLRNVHARACECLADAYVRNGEPSLAVVVARELVSSQPFRETGYQALMRANLAQGNRAEALWVYERCRKIISEELGVAPSPETNAVYREVLKSK
jgi:DNA-binding SARP family transcriptional activator